ncbi:hypothetical protein CNMCM5793_003300 [Aspergillus hiratsukae]|uniref:Heme haloperoxidase family profile domain-containing protein n=1 Tax=Aspergillus hiratsukae TaxID=1194566 RepID=A0A8H6PDY5_9EURO|nr:hypothetical protein CNMCM5793_003300 [Aspergillus hiratsukae]
MKAIISLAILGLGSLASGFPDGMGGSAFKNCPYAALKGNEDPELRKRLLIGSMSKPIDVTGVHAFQPPNFENGDQRGPCPALNALANHGYIPRSGVVSFVEAVDLCSVWNGSRPYHRVGTDGSRVDGQSTCFRPQFLHRRSRYWSQQSAEQSGGLLGEPQSFIGSHNFIEADSSNTRDNPYVTGTSCALNMDEFMEWYNMSTDGTFSMDLMAERAKIRMDQSIQANPEFYYGPVTGLIARNAAKEIFRSFFAIYEEEGNLTYREGWKSIPENWYKTLVDYGLVQLNLDMVNWILKYPVLGSIGGNTSTVNSFAGVDLSDLTGGVLNLTTLLQGNNLLYFVFQVLKFASANALAGLYKTLAVQLEMITQVIPVPLLNLLCPAFKDLQMGGRPFWDAIMDDFPGALKSGGAL